MRKILLFYIALLSSLAVPFRASAQFYTMRSAFLKANSNWYMLRYFLDMKQDPLQLVQLDQQAPGGMNVSDPQTGALRFIAGGTYAYDRDHHLMPHTFPADSINAFALGNNFTVLPFLDDPDKYHMVVLTSDPSTIAYVTVDMNLNGGLGDIDTTSFTLLRGHMSYDDALAEIIDVIPGNNCDLWLLVAETGFAAKKMNVLAYHVTAAGIAPNPVVSTFDRENESDWSWEFRVSPNRDLISFLTYKYYYGGHYEPTTQIGFLTFDPDNGTAHQGPQPAIKLDWGFYEQVHGTFTPDNNYYIVYHGVFSSGLATLYQYDLDAYAQGYNRKPVYYNFTYQHVPASKTDVFEPPQISFKNYGNNVFFSIPWADERPCGHIDGVPVGTYIDVYYGGTEKIGHFLPSVDQGWGAVTAAPEFDLKRHGSLPLINDIAYPFPPGDTIRSVYFDTVFCYDPGNLYFSPVTLQAKPGFSNYVWDDGTTGTERTITKPGKYWVYYKGDCNNRMDTFIYRYRVLDKLLPPDSIVCDQRFPVHIVAKEEQQLLWDDNSTDKAREIYHPGTYWIEGASEGCKAYDTITLTSKYCPCHVSVPNAFTPNSDGLNDYFKPSIAPGCVPSGYSFRIFNRWGQMVYSSFNEFDAGWDGSSNGRQADIGAYFYEIHFKSRFLENDYYQKGELILVR